MKFNKILVVNINKETLEPIHWKRINSLAKKLEFTKREDKDFAEKLKDADCALLNISGMDTKTIDLAPSLKYIGVLATAFGKVAIDHAKKRGIAVTNVPGYSTEAVAELIFAILLDAIRGVEVGKQRGRDGNFSEDGIKAFEIKDKNFGILGLGAIGSRTAEIALGFGAKVNYWSKNRKKDYEKKGLTYQDADKLIAESDILSINLAQNSETNGFLNKKRINSLKKGAVVINTCPMDLVDLDALELRLKKNDITFIFDHADELAMEYKKRFSKYPNAILYPPIAYITKEASDAKREIFTSNVENFVKGKPTNLVN